MVKITENKVYFAVRQDKAKNLNKITKTDQEDEIPVLFNIEKCDPLKEVSENGVDEEALNLASKIEWYRGRTYFNQKKAVESLSDLYGKDLMFVGFGLLDSNIKGIFKGG